MSVSPPQPSIGALWPLGIAIQTSIGVPVPVPATAGSWVNTTDNTLTYTTGEHMIATALGTRATEQESAQGETRVEGGFGANLRTTTARNLLAAYFGTATDSGSVRTISVSNPSLLTIFDNWSGEQHQYQDCMLNTLTLQCQTHTEWKLAFTVLGGTNSTVDSGVPTFDPADRTLAWADVSGLSGLFSVVPCQISQLTVNFNNGVKQDYGAGSHASCALIGGAFTINGTALMRYDDSNAAEVEAAYIAGTDTGPMTLTIDGGGGNSHTLTFPNITITNCRKMAPLDDYVRMELQYGVKSAQNFTWTMPSA